MTLRPGGAAVGASRRAANRAPAFSSRDTVAATRRNRSWRPLVLSVPVVELGAGPAHEEPLAGRVVQADLAAVRVLDDVRREERREHQDADGPFGAVAELVRSGLAA